MSFNNKMDRQKIFSQESTVRYLTECTYTYIAIGTISLCATRKYQFSFKEVKRCHFEPTDPELTICINSQNLEQVTKVFFFSFFLGGGALVILHYM